MAPAATEDLPPSVTEEVVIAQGCTSGCTYCFSRLARGRLSSVPVGEVVRRVRDATARGIREIRLTGLDTAAWGEDLAGPERLPELLGSVAKVPGDFQVRVGMMSPQSLEPHRDAYFDALARAPFYRFLHLPLQSGSDRILDAMRRGYHTDLFRRQVDAARRRLPDVHLATDVIVGFPGETEDDFRATEELLEATGPETVNVTRFSPRPGTPAARLPPLPPRVAKRRSRALASLRQRISRTRLERWIGTRGPGRVLSTGPEVVRSLASRTTCPWSWILALPSARAWSSGWTAQGRPTFSAPWWTRSKYPTVPYFDSSGRSSARRRRREIRCRA